jgi:hypothetical protein
MVAVEGFDQRLIEKNWLKINAAGRRITITLTTAITARTALKVLRTKNRH